MWSKSFTLYKGKHNEALDFYIKIEGLVVFAFIRDRASFKEALCITHLEGGRLMGYKNLFQNPPIG